MHDIQWETRKCHIALDNFIREHGLVIEEKKIDSYNYYIDYII